jgi:5-enolpyruvylshikimate-3-phosphate synthase
MRYSPTIACLWAISGAGTAVVTWHEAISSGIQLAYLALTALGGAVILLYQKKLSVDRENRDSVRAANLAWDLDAKAKTDQLIAVTTATALQEVHTRLDAVIAQRDHEAKRADQLFEQLKHLAELTEHNRCVFPVDGAARCLGREVPPA